MSVHEFYRLKALITLEEVNTTEWSEKNKNLNWQNCNGRVFDLFLAMNEMTCHVIHSFDIWQSCNFSGIEALEFSCIYTRGIACYRRLEVFHRRK